MTATVARTPAHDVPSANETASPRCTTSNMHSSGTASYGLEVYFSLTRGWCVVVPTSAAPSYKYNCVPRMPSSATCQATSFLRSIRRFSRRPKQHHQLSAKTVCDDTPTGSCCVCPSCHTRASLCLPRCLGDTRKATPRSKRAVRSCCSGLKLQALRLRRGPTCVISPLANSFGVAVHSDACSLAVQPTGGGARR